VRGITCGSHGAQGFPEIEALARRLQLHFTGNPRFERLPKKFKIGIEASAAGGRHLIQDVGLVLSGAEEGRNSYDIWIAGGLGREPRPGFLLCERLPEERLIPVIEAVIKVYAANAPPPKRLKFLAAQFGEEQLRQLIEAESVYGEELPPVTGLPLQLTAPPDRGTRFELPVFAGELTSGELEEIAAAADKYSDGVLLVTANQDIALQLGPEIDAAAVLADLRQLSGTAADAVGCTMRVCPGNHECLMGLAPTREVARQLSTAISDAGRSLVWALSGCPNSCSQPQLADVGIVSSRLTTGENGEKTPLFDLYRRSGAGLGERVLERLPLAQLLTEVGRLV
jgi:sulfite reductase beta subunit-like hemoprotein